MQESLRILLVEDNENDYLLAVEQIDQRKIKITWVRTLSDALNTLAKQSFDAILLDLGLPDSSGIGTLEKICQRLGHIPIVVLTGQDDETLAKEALRRGAQDYLFKGQVSGELLARSLRYSVERHHFDVELRRANEELSATNARLRVAHEEALEANELKSQFLATISHEIRTPLSGIVSLSELILQERDEERLRDLMNLLHGSALQLERIINDVLDFSKLEAGRMVPEDVSCSVREIIAEVVQSVKPIADRKGLEIVPTISEAVPDTIVTDRIRLKQIISNLVHNAVKFTQKGTVDIQADVHWDEDKSPHLSLVVVDTGIGIAAEAQEAIFLPFVQADGSTTRRYGGSGLGLAICKKSVDLLAGKIGFESKEGEGCKFWCEIPITRGVA
jgi:signal transduction histidine kinase